MTVVSTRIPDDLEKEIEWYAKKESIGKAIALRKILDKGIKEIRIDHALDMYRKGKITLMKAAEIAGTSLWEILDMIREKRMPMLYTSKDAEKDIRASLEG